MKPIIYLVIVCVVLTFSTQLAVGQKPKKKGKNAADEVKWEVYQTTQSGVSIRVKFPVPFQTKTQNEPVGTTCFLFGEDSLHKTTYSFYYTVHKTPIGRYDYKSLLEMAFVAFANQFQMEEEISAQPYKNLYIEGLESRFTYQGVAYRFQTYIYGNIQFQALVTYPATYQIQLNQHQSFFNNISVK